MDRKASSEAGHLVGRIHRAAGARFARELEARGGGVPGGAEGTFLYLLWRRGPAATGELSREAGYPKSTATSVLDRLERDGWIERSKREGDRREVEVRASPKAEALYGLFAEVSEDMNGAWLRGFSDKQAERLVRYLRRVLANLEEE